MVARRTRRRAPGAQPHPRQGQQRASRRRTFRRGRSNSRIGSCCSKLPCAQPDRILRNPCCTVALGWRPQGKLSSRRRLHLTVLQAAPDAGRCRQDRERPESRGTHRPGQVRGDRGALPAPLPASHCNLLSVVGSSLCVLGRSRSFVTHFWVFSVLT